MDVKDHLEKLGLKGQDKVTGFKGVIDSVAFDLYGCIQASLRPTINDNGEIPDGGWFDIARIKITGKKAVMETPNFDCGVMAEGKHGPSDKTICHAKTAMKSRR